MIERCFVLFRNTSHTPKTPNTPPKISIFDTFSRHVTYLMIFGTLVITKFMLTNTQINTAPISTTDYQRSYDCNHFESNLIKEKQKGVRFLISLVLIGITSTNNFKIYFSNTSFQRIKNCFHSRNHIFRLNNSCIKEF